ncbi:hypothetical protein CDD83_7745 [Cordyceps sp. RAO-2017]|nr:hypothetical protein CDD83_7745 [Cordyceps sp. RAO-2017]
MYISRCRRQIGHSFAPRTSPAVLPAAKAPASAHCQPRPAHWPPAPGRMQKPRELIGRPSRLRAHRRIDIRLARGPDALRLYPPSRNAHLGSPDIILPGGGGDGIICGPGCFLPDPPDGGLVMRARRYRRAPARAVENRPTTDDAPTDDDDAAADAVLDESPASKDGLQRRSFLRPSLTPALRPPASATSHEPACANLRPPRQALASQPASSTQCVRPLLLERPCLE